MEDVMLCIDDDGGTYEKARLERPDGSIVRTIDMAGLVHADDPELETQTVACLEWSPDGSQLACRVNGKRSPSPGMAEADAGAYSRYSGLWVVEVDGSDARELVDNFEIDGDYGEVGIVGWSADGESVLFQVATGFSASITSDGLRLFAVPIHGGEVHQIDGQLLSRDELQDWQSPGQILAITEGAWRATWTNKRIALADLDTGGLRYLTPPETAAFSPAMSPDGRKIAYVAAPDIGDIPGGDDARLGMAKRRIWLMNADGSNKRLLTDDNAYRDERPMWSRDGEYILFTRIDAEYTASLWVVVPRTGFLRQVARLSMAVPPVDPPLWFGFYGYVAWDRYYDWWQP